MKIPSEDLPFCIKTLLQIISIIDGCCAFGSHEFGIAALFLNDKIKLTVKKVRNLTYHQALMSKPLVALMQ